MGDEAFVILPLLLSCTCYDRINDGHPLPTHVDGPRFAGRNVGWQFCQLFARVKDPFANNITLIFLAYPVLLSFVYLFGFQLF